MEDLLASRRATLKRQRGSEDMNSITSYKEASIEANGYQRSGSDPVNTYQSDTDDHTYHDALECTTGPKKHQRSSPPFDENNQEVKSSQTGLYSEELFPSTTQRATRYSFDAHRKQSRKSTVPTRLVTIPTPGAMSVRFGAGYENLVASDAPEPSPGMQAKPIELSNSSSSCTDNDENAKAEGFLLDQLPIQEDGPDSDNLIQSGQETQLSLSTSAFESQISDRSRVGNNIKKIQNRKEAYKAARKVNGAWEVEHSLISLRASHNEEEIEL